MHHGAPPPRPAVALLSRHRRRMLLPHRRRHQADLTRLFNAEALTSPPFGQLLAAQFTRALGAVALAAFGAPNALAAHTAVPLRHSRAHC